MLTKDLPCTVEILPQCFLPGDVDDWPNDPREVNAISVRLEDSLAANISWKPPYDYSIQKLTGFQLTLHVVENGNTHAMGPPICIFVNLTSDKWNKWDDTEWNNRKYVSHTFGVKLYLDQSRFTLSFADRGIRDIIFYNDCFRAAHPMAITYYVSSLPHSTVQPTPIYKLLELKGIEEKPPWEPWMRKNFTDDGKTVVVSFGPPVPEAFEYEICLEDTLYQWDCVEKRIIPFTTNTFEFKNLSYNKTYCISVSISVL
ncbi:hypothetical protein ScPMuIL_007907 [Solemya velum]